MCLKKSLYYNSIFFITRLFFSFFLYLLICMFFFNLNLIIIQSLNESKKIFQVEFYLTDKKKKRNENDYVEKLSKKKRI